MLRPAVTTMLIISLQSCTSNTPTERVDVQVRNSNKQDLPSKPQLPYEPGGESKISYQRSEGTLPIVLDERELRQTFAVSTDSLNFKFSYADQLREGAVNFTSGKASIQLKGLPVGKTGPLRFELYEQGTLKIVGEKQSVTLQPGLNSERLVLRKVSGDEFGSLNLELELKDIQVPQDKPSEPQGRPEAPPADPQVLPQGRPETPPSVPPGGPDGIGGSERAQAAMTVIVKHCSECHHPGRPNVFNTIPMKSTIGQDTKGIVQRMIETIESGTMPPAPRDRPSADEISKLKLWQSEL